MDEDFLQSTTPSCTPDLFLLEQAEHHLVFDCGPLMYDMPSICSAYTVEKLSLWKKDCKFAIPIKMSESPKARVGGTIYLMNTDEIVRLDKHRQNGISFDRKLMPVLTPYLDELGEPSLLPKPVWMYVARKDHWEEQIKWDLQFHKRGNGRSFELADTFPSDKRVLHNHYRFSGITIEHHNLPALPCVTATDAVRWHCEIKNEREIARLRRNNFLKRLKFW